MSDRSISINIIVLCHLLNVVDGAPTDISGYVPPLKNRTALNDNYAPSWVAQPPYRGTWSILYSCAITLGLCVYTVIHLYGTWNGSNKHECTDCVLIDA
jgi:hypothetical protein